MPPSSCDCPRSAEPGPFARILIGSAPAEGGADGHALAAQLAKLSGAKVVLANRADPSHRVSDSAARRLHDAAVSQQADLIVVGSADREPIARVLSGSVAGRLFSGAPCAVAVAPRGYATAPACPLRQVLVAVDGSSAAGTALRAAHALATRAGAALKVLTVIVPNSPSVPVGKGIPLHDVDLEPATAEAEHPATLRLAEPIRRQTAGARAMLAAVTAELRGATRIEQQVVVGPDVAFMIIEAAREHVDLIVLGSRAHGPLRRVLLGSVSNQVIRHAPCPVLVMPRASHTPARLGLTSAR